MTLFKNAFWFTKIGERPLITWFKRVAFFLQIEFQRSGFTIKLIDRTMGARTSSRRMVRRRRAGLTSVPMTRFHTKPHTHTVCALTCVCGWMNNQSTTTTTTLGKKQQFCRSFSFIHQNNFLVGNKRRKLNYKIWIFPISSLPVSSYFLSTQICI